VQIFLDHQRDVLRRRSAFRLKNIDRRLNVIEGLIQAYINLDRVIQIIREENEPKVTLAFEFELSDLQVEAILNLRLRALRKLDEEKLIKEQEELMKEREELEDLLESPSLQWVKVKLGLENTQKILSTEAKKWDRLTDFQFESEDLLDLVEYGINDNSPVTVVLSKNGWIRTYKGHELDDNLFKIRDGDSVKFCINLQKSEKLSLMTSEGRSYTLSIDQINKDKGYGEPLNILIGMSGTTKVISAFKFEADKKGLVFSKKGLGFLVDLGSLESSTKLGKQIFEPNGNDEVIGLYKIDGEKVMILSEENKLLIFPVNEIPTLKKGKGVRLQKYKTENIVGIMFFREHDLNTLIKKLGLKELDELKYWNGKRGQVGKLAPKKLLRKKIRQF
jgi:topoisomerase-4 subunit A